MSFASAIAERIAAPAPGPEWRTTARPEQVRPEGCDIFILRGGRGSGKTRSGAEDCLERVRSGDITRVHVLAPTFGDARDVCIEGPSGIKACARPGEIANWNRSMGEIYFANGVFLKIFGAEEPGRLNGPQCGHLWVDEFWACSIDAIDQAEFGLRIGKRVTSTWTSTPKATGSTKYVLGFDGAVIRRMRTRDNISNLAPSVVEKLEKKYKGTRLEKVELDGELLEDVQGALWQSGIIDPYRVLKLPDNIVKIAVGVDPSVSDPQKKKNPHKDPDECGIIVAAVSDDFRGYVINDLSGIFSPNQWAKVSVGAYNHYRAALISAEGNQGGELVAEVVRSIAPGINIQIVHASIGKRARAEPLAACYEQGRIHHVAALGESGNPDWEHLSLLEDEMCSWDASDPSAPSPNRVDGLVWAFDALGLIYAGGNRTTQRISTNGTYNREYSRVRQNRPYFREEEDEDTAGE